MSANAVSVGGWVLIAAGFIACSWTAYRSNGRFPSLVDIVRAAVRSPPGRWLMIAMWLWIGVHLFVRRG